MGGFCWWCARYLLASASVLVFAAVPAVTVAVAGAGAVPITFCSWGGTGPTQPTRSPPMLHLVFLVCCFAVVNRLLFGALQVLLASIYVAEPSPAPRPRRPAFNTATATTGDNNGGAAAGIGGDHESEVMDGAPSPRPRQAQASTGSNDLLSRHERQLTKVWNRCPGCELLLSCCFCCCCCNPSYYCRL